MSTTPPDQAASGRSTPGYTPGPADALARLPVPGNAEFLLFLFVWIILALIWAFGDEVGDGTFATLTVALTFGYLVSRGIAKASRVMEH